VDYGDDIVIFWFSLIFPLDEQLLSKDKMLAKNFFRELLLLYKCSRLWARISLFVSRKKIKKCHGGLKFEH